VALWLPWRQKKWKVLKSAVLFLFVAFHPIKFQTRHFFSSSSSSSFLFFRESRPWCAIFLMPTSVSFLHGDGKWKRHQTEQQHQQQWIAVAVGSYKIADCQLNLILSITVVSYCQPDRLSETAFKVFALSLRLLYRLVRIKCCPTLLSLIILQVLFGCRC
jgi:hypothetical protein